MDIGFCIGPSTLGPARVLVEDPCPLALPEILTSCRGQQFSSPGLRYLEAIKAQEVGYLDL